MGMINWHFYIYLCFIILNYRLNGVYSIQCCRDITCLEKRVDCPLNVCFKLVLSKDAEDRGCMNDLMKLVKFPLIENINDVSGSSNDQCQKLDGLGDGMSLCKCTSSLCNSSFKSSSSYFSFPVLIFIVFVVYQFSCVFLS